MVNLLDKILPIAGIVIAVQTREIIIWTGGQCNALHVIIILIMVICWVKITYGGIKLSYEPIGVLSKHSTPKKGFVFDYSKFGLRWAHKGFQCALTMLARVSLKAQNIFLRPGDLIPTVFRYEDTKNPFPKFRLHI